MTEEKPANNPAEYPGYQAAQAAPVYSPPPPPQSMYPPPVYNGSQPAVVVVNAAPLAQPIPFSRGPQPAHCMHCNAPVTTVISHEIGMFPVAIGALICAAGCWLGCCLIPCCIEDLKDVVHYCPRCKAKLGANRKDLTGRRH